jgi:hypothetical protein
MINKLLFLASVFMAVSVLGCGGGGSGGTGGGSGTAQASDNGGQGNGGGNSCPLFNEQFMVPCPDSVAAFPEVLKKSGNFVFLVTKVNGNTVINLLAPGDYLSNDGRNCSYTVNNDGSVTSN